MICSLKHCLKLIWTMGLDPFLLLFRTKRRTKLRCHRSLYIFTNLELKEKNLVEVRIVDLSRKNINNKYI